MKAAVGNKQKSPGMISETQGRGILLAFCQPAKHLSGDTCVDAVCAPREKDKHCYYVRENAGGRD